MSCHNLSVLEYKFNENKSNSVIVSSWFLFILDLVNDALTFYDYIPKWKDDYWLMKRKECGRKPSLYNVRYHPDIYLKGLRKATNTTVSVTGLLGPLSYEAGIPTTRLCRSVFSTISEVKELLLLFTLFPKFTEDWRRTHT